MPNRETIYNVTVSHPTGYITGTHTVRVKYKCLTVHYAEHRYCDSIVFGCSRDYYGCNNDKDAIRLFLAEHACTATHIVAEPMPVEDVRQEREDHMVEVKVNGTWHLACDVSRPHVTHTMGNPMCIGELVIVR